MGKRWICGIDVGTNSTGLAAIEVDEKDTPVSILTMLSVIHDGGVDPDGEKTKTSRQSSAGVARRVRRLYRERRRRLRALQVLLNEVGYVESDPDLNPWKVRARLLDGYIEDDRIRFIYLRTAIAHIAHHRGWRNPWLNVEALRNLPKPSEALIELNKERLGEENVGETPLTVGQLGYKGALPRRGQGLRLFQQDLLWELERIFEIQRVSDRVAKDVTNLVFRQKKPSVPVERVGTDPFDKSMRASSGTLEFQEFRVLDKVANLRIIENREKRELTVLEKEKVLERLLDPVAEAITWAQVAEEILGVDEARLVTSEGSYNRSAPARGNESLTRYVEFLSKYRKKIPTLVNWWDSASGRDRADLIATLAESAILSSLEDANESVAQLLAELPEEELLLLEGHLELPSGRSSYSRRTLSLLNEKMRTSGCDLRGALEAVFQIGPDWTPPLPTFEELTQQPTVDRNISAIRKFLSSAELRWGAPSKVVVELAREGLKSPKSKLKVESEQRKKQTVNDLKREELVNSGVSSPSRGDVVRHTLLQIFESRCLYCDASITWDNSEIDHIVARADGGKNGWSNLALVCRSCNLSKGKRPFGLWASPEQLKETLRKVAALPYPEGGRWTRTEFKGYKESLKWRLMRKSQDDNLDDRSIESTAYAAVAIRDRIKSKYQGVPIEVFSGVINSEARKHIGLNISEVLGRGYENKKRLDRRHHAVDAAMVAILNRSVGIQVARAVEFRDFYMLERCNSGGSKDRYKTCWEEAVALSNEKISATSGWNTWWDHANLLIEMIRSEAAQDRIAVVNPLRLRANHGPVHADTIRPLDQKVLGEKWTSAEIARVVDPEVWEELRVRSATTKSGLIPEDWDRELVLTSGTLSPQSKIRLFPTAAAMIPVRGGAAEMGYIHHARIYAWLEKDKVRFGMVRVFTADLALNGLNRRGIDIFTHPLPLFSISMRNSEAKVSEKVGSGEAVLLGPIFTGDEFEFASVDSVPGSGDIQEFLKVFPERRFRLDGFPSNAKLRVRPSYLAPEGVLDTNRDIDAVKAILIGRGWWPACQVIFSAQGLKVIRRSSLGRPRWHDSGLPKSWEPMSEARRLLECPERGESSML